MDAILSKAAVTGRADILSQCLQEHGVDPDMVFTAENCESKEYVGWTSLHICCALGHVDCVRILLRSGARTDILCPGKLLALEKSTDSSIVNAFMQESIQAVVLGDVIALERLLKSGIDINQTDGTEKNNTLLHWAATCDKGEDVFNVLLSYDPDQQKTNSDGRSPKQEAHHCKSVSAIKCLDPTPAKIECQTKANDKISPISKTSDESELEEKDILIDCLRKDLEGVLRNGGVLNFITSMQQRIDELKRENEKLRDKTEQLNEFLSSRDEIYELNGLQSPQKRRESLNSPLRNDVKELQLKNRVDHKFFEQELRQKDERIDELEKQLEETKFKLKMRTALEQL